MPSDRIEPLNDSPRMRYDADRRSLFIGDRPLPVSTAIIDNGRATLEFRMRRVLVPFENQWQLSILWGAATYSDNHDYISPLPDWRGVESQPFVEEPRTVEVGVLHPTYGLVGDPLGYVTPNHLLALAHFVATLPSNAPAREVEHDGTVEGFITAWGH